MENLLWRSCVSHPDYAPGLALMQQADTISAMRSEARATAHKYRAKLAQRQVERKIPGMYGVDGPTFDGPPLASVAEASLKTDEQRVEDLYSEVMPMDMATHNAIVEEIADYYASLKV